MKKIPKGAEASNILVGEVDFLDKPLPAFIRYQLRIPMDETRKENALKIHFYSNKNKNKHYPY
jgi:hypothetical protein